MGELQRSISLLCSGCEFMSDPAPKVCRRKSRRLISRVHESRSNPEFAAFALVFQHLGNETSKLLGMRKSSPPRPGTCMGVVVDIGDLLYLVV